MNRILKAGEIAAYWHRKQKRKANGLPFISHPLAVGLILQSLHQREEVIISGILHDLLEDTAIPPHTIEKEFGEEVLLLVKSLTEDKMAWKWKARKTGYIERIKAANLDVRTISAADKYHNLFSLKADKEKFGSGIWRFFRQGMDEQYWFYSSLLEIYSSTPVLHDYYIVKDMEDFINDVFQR